jgi:predicted amidohydrolase
MVSIIGMPLFCDNQLFNCAVAVQNGGVLGIVPKIIYRATRNFTRKDGLPPARMQ